MESDSDQQSDIEAMEQGSSKTSREDKAVAEWTKESTNKLIHQVMALTSPGEAIPYFKKVIDWEEVSWDSHSAERCQKKWNDLLTKVRHYRTIVDVATDMIGFLERKSACSQVIHWNRVLQKEQQETTVQKKKKKDETNNPYPKKPKPSAYTIFTMNKLRELKNENLKGKELMMSLGNAWRNLDPEDKEYYQDLWEKELASYVSQLEKYSEEHPDDMKLEGMIEDAKKKVKQASKKSKKNSAAKATIVNQASPVKSPKKSKSAPNIDHSQLTDGTLDSGLETTTTDSPVKSPKKRSHKDTDTNTEGSPKKRPHKSTDIDSAESSPKKKKHKQRRITGEMLYIEQKREGYGLEHPDLDTDELEGKLKRKYTRLSEKKKAKYEQLAAEMSMIS